MRILVINPGGTSTKISVFEGKKQVFKKNISHTQADLNDFLAMKFRFHPIFRPKKALHWYNLDILLKYF